MISRRVHMLIILGLVAVLHGVLFFLPVDGYENFFSVLRPAAYILIFIYARIVLGKSLVTYKTRKTLVMICIMGVLLYLGLSFVAGLIAEDSKRTDTMFDFAIGLAEDLTGRTVQLETSDIAYSVLIMRFGYVGTFFFMMIYFYMIYFCYKKRENKHAFSSFLFLVMSILLAFFSSSILYPVTYLLPLIIINYVNKSEPVEDVDAALQEGGC
jgi:cell division protein FtsW (lipid II flippase)